MSVCKLFLSDAHLVYVLSQTRQKIYDHRSSIGRAAVDNVAIYFATQHSDLGTSDERAKHVGELLAPGSKLPFLYAHVKRNKDDKAS